ncbi:gluconokinase [Erwinia typographi]|uniref:gluconokinase n=1 Tax=Erwinia typographi TaxID=371042 RepID=UPI00068950AF|nr:gluconokinase [Erwinia typographi]
MTQSATVLAIDMGSSSLRVSLFDMAGNPIGDCVRRSYQLDTDLSGRATLACESLFADLFSALDALLTQPNDGSEIVAVGISTFWHSLVGIDAHQRPVTPVITWADGRAAHEAAALKFSGITGKLHRTTGCPVHSSFWPARLRWLEKAHPEVVQQTRHWLSAADLLFLMLFGEMSTSLSMASGSGLLDINQQIWSPLATSIAHVDRATLPAISEAPRRQLLPKWATRWPRLATIPWFPAWGDGACSNIGVGAQDEESLVLMLGTSGSMRRVWQAESVELNDPAMWCYRVDAQRFAGGMALSEGGNSAAWARQLITPEEAVDLEARIATMTPDAHGLSILPYFLGSRSPAWSEGRSAAILGLNAGTTPLEIYRATLESVGLRFAFLKQQLEKSWPASPHIIATGAGFSNSPVWAQIVADCLGEPLTVSPVEEGSLRGAALLTLERLGIPVAPPTAFPQGRTIQPDGQAHRIYCHARDRQAAFDAGILDILRRRLDELN